MNLVPYVVPALLLFTSAVGVYAVVTNLPRVPGEWRTLSRARKTRLVVALVAAVLYATVVVWMISAGIWVPLARGQDVSVTPDQVLALERRVADLEAALQRTANTFNPILHHGRTVETWLDPTTGPVVTVTKDELGKIQFFIESGVGGGGDLHVAGAVVIESDLTVKGAISSDL